MRTLLNFFMVGGLILATGLRVSGQLRLPGFFSDNMVLQRDHPVHFWGKGIPGKTVNIRFSGTVKKGVVKTDSTWSLFFGRKRASSIPRSVVIESGGQTVILKNILIGDIWICSGQSNMEFPFEKEAHAREEYAYADQPLIRWCNPAPAGRYVYGVAYTDSLRRRLCADSFYLWAGWRSCDSSSVRPMSAVAYYFAKKIVAYTAIPVGVINLSIGGAPIETFINREALAGNRRFAPKARKGNWLDNESLPAWTRQRGRENLAGGFLYGDESGPNHAYKPGMAYTCGIAPLLAMPVKGVIWYQGESNSLEIDRVEEYPALMQLMIEDYRERWRLPRMPFYWVQLSSIDTAHYQSRYWPAFRDGQRLSLGDIAYGGMAVCSDLGARDNVHPTDKRTVGKRLARWALNRDYHLAIAPSGPLPVSARYAHGEVIVYFRYGHGLRTADGQDPREISLDGRQDVPAFIQEGAIHVKTGSRPAFIWYGWHPFSCGNLVNSEGLPASTFKVNVK